MVLLPRRVWGNIGLSPMLTRLKITLRRHRVLFMDIGIRMEIKS